MLCYIHTKHITYLLVQSIHVASVAYYASSNDPITVQAPAPVPTHLIVTASPSDRITDEVAFATLPYRSAPVSVTSPVPRLCSSSSAPDISDVACGSVTVIALALAAMR